MLFDAFVCHASEDKDLFVRPLAEALRNQHIEVWYDEFSLRVGDSLRRSIDQGLRQSRFGIVVLSEAFFSKQWSQWELDGLVARQNDDSGDVILPIWHGVNRHDVLAFSPPLADKLAASTADGVDAVVRQLVSVIRPQGSTLVIAREQLLAKGVSPPVISDDWWLDVAASAESNDSEGDFQEATGWGRWGFPLPPRSSAPDERGLRLAWAAMQMHWQDVANTKPVTQLTPPTELHEFIASQPGLEEACHTFAHYLIAYAPQLVIPGFGGQFESKIQEFYERSAAHCEERRAVGDRSGTALTTDGRHPGCDDLFALRDPEFGRYSTGHVACGYFQGNFVATGPPVRYFAHTDHLIWLLSRASDWLPAGIKSALCQGMVDWPVWIWHAGDRRFQEDFGFEEEPFTGAFGVWVEEAKPGELPPAGSEALDDLQHRLAFGAELLGLPETPVDLASRFLSADVLGAYLSSRVSAGASPPRRR